VGESVVICLLLLLYSDGNLHPAVLEVQRFPAAVAKDAIDAELWTSPHAVHILEPRRKCSAEQIRTVFITTILSQPMTLTIHSFFLGCRIPNLITQDRRDCSGLLPA